MLFCLTVPAFADSAFSDMPNDYSTAVLEAAVANGLLNGSEGKLLPGENLTRAQMAAIINRAFGASKQDSITGYTDVDSGAWYYEELAKAVHMKTLNGYGGTLAPNAFITRQEAFAVVARALKLPEGTAYELAEFSDYASVADWAVGTTAAMVSSGYVNGAGGKINPTSCITRKDFAVLMDNVIKSCITKAGTYSEVGTGSLVINAPDVTLKNVTVQGNLIIGDGVGDGNVTLDSVRVEGTTIVRGGGVNSFIVKGDSFLGKIVVSKVDGNVRVAVEGSAKTELVDIMDGKDDVIVEGSIGKLIVTGADIPVVVQNAAIGELTITAQNAEVTVAKTADVTSVTSEAAGTALTVHGKVSTVSTTPAAIGTKVEVAKGASVGTINAAAQTQIKGEGTVNTANISANDVTVDTVGTQTKVDTGITGTTVGGEAFSGGTTTTPPGSGSGGSSGGGSGSGFIPPTESTIADFVTVPAGVTAETKLDIGTKTYTVKLTGEVKSGIQQLGNTTANAIEASFYGSGSFQDKAAFENGIGNYPYTAIIFDRSKLTDCFADSDAKTYVRTQSAKYLKAYAGDSNVSDTAADGLYTKDFSDLTDSAVLKVKDFTTIIMEGDTQTFYFKNGSETITIVFDISGLKFTEVNVTDAAGLSAALANPDRKLINVTQDITLTANTEIAADKTVVIAETKTLTVSEGAALAVNGTLTNNGTLTIDSSNGGYYWFSQAAAFKNGDANILGGDSPLFTQYGQSELSMDKYGCYNISITSYGDEGVITDNATDYTTLNKDYEIQNGQLKVYNKSTLVIPEGITLTVPQEYKIKVNDGGYIKVDGSLTVNGTIENNSDIDVNGTLTSSSKLSNSGFYWITANASF